MMGSRQIWILGIVTLVSSLWAFGGIEQMFAQLPELVATSAAVLFVFTVADKFIPGGRIFS